MTYLLDNLKLRVGRRHFYLPRDKGRCAVVYDDRLETFQRFSVEEAAFGQPARHRYEVPGFKITVVNFEDTPAARYGPFAPVDSLTKMQDVETTFPVFIHADKRIVLVPRVAVNFDQRKTDAGILAKRFGARIVSEEPGFAVLGLAFGADVLAAADEIAGMPGVYTAEPDLITISRRVKVPDGNVRAFSTIDPSTPQQGFLQISAGTARELAGDIGSITVAVLDDGVDVEHPALTPALIGSFDAINSGSSYAPNPWDYHGTACAGLIAARAAAVRDRGIAVGVKLLGVRIAQSPGPGQPWSTSNSILRRGIDWALRHGADVLSNSWGGPPSALVSDAITRGLSTGRDGKGAVFAFAVGNSGGPVEFPASLSGVIAVGGVNSSDEHKTRSSSDGEYWWASNTGPEIDIAAPSVGLHTADYHGVPGRTVSDWRDDFNGTSAACPIVAGVAALALSLRPSLSADAVTGALKETADQVGSAGYDGSGHNLFLGHGRVNAEAALRHLSAKPSPGRDERPAARETLELPMIIVGEVLPIPLSHNVTIYTILSASGGPTLFFPSESDRIHLDAAARNGTTVSIRFSSRDTTPIGDVLLNPVLVSDPMNPGESNDAFPPSGDVPEPGEVLLPRSEDDVFSTFKP